MLRRLFTVLSALSLLLCAAVVVLWVRSYWVADIVQRGRADGGLLEVSGIRGGLMLLSVTAGASAPDGSDAGTLWLPGITYLRASPDDGSAWDSGGPETDWHVAGIRYRAGAIYGTLYARTLAVPYWLLLMVFGVPVAGWLTGARKRRSRKRRQQDNLCPLCGYDLRATPDRCPECGAASAGDDQAAG